MDLEKASINFKVIIIGNQSTGKTSLINKYVYNKFSNDYKATIVSQFDYKIIKKEEQNYRLSFWDLAGQDKNPEMIKLFSQDSNGVIICCEVNNIKSMKDTLIWKENLINSIDINKVTIILCENKCDLLNKNDEKINLLENFSQENKFNKCFRTSSLNGYGIEDMMNYLLDDMIKRLEFNEDGFDNSLNSFSLGKKKEKKEKKKNEKKKCC